MRKDVSARENPLFQEVTPLEFDGLSEAEVLALTPQQEGERFLSRWLEAMRPFTAYRRALSDQEGQRSRRLREVKVYFVKFVVEGEWSEQKYVVVLDHLLTHGLQLTEHSFQKGEELWVEGRLELQRREKKAARRRL